MDDYTTEHAANEIPYGYCHCGCGRKTKIAPKSDKSHNYVKGEPRPCIRGHRLQPFVVRFWNNIDVRGPDDCWNWKAHTNTGYGTMHKDGKGHYAHRISYELAKGLIPDNLIVRHICNNRLCCNPAHLILGTAQDNSNDAKAAGRQARGERSGVPKLTTAQVLEIRRLHLVCHISLAAIGRQFGITKVNAGDVAHYKTWKHVP